MFWKKKDYSKIASMAAALPSTRELVDNLYRNSVMENTKKINLILDHLNLEYIPEKNVTEKAKLVEKFIPAMGGSTTWTSTAFKSPTKKSKKK